MSVIRCNQCGGIIDGTKPQHTADYQCRCFAEGDTEPRNTSYTPLQDKRFNISDRKILLSDKIRSHIGTVNIDPPLWEWFTEALELEKKLLTKQIKS